MFASQAVEDMVMGLTYNYQLLYHCICQFCGEFGRELQSEFLRLAYG